MKTPMKPLAVILVLGLTSVAACALITEPRPELPPADLPVEMGPAELGFEGSVFSIEGGEGTVVVRDRAITGVCHRYEDHGAYLDGDEVVIWIAHTGARSRICPDIGIVFGYEAVIGGLPAGERDVRVEYIGDVSSDSYPRPALSARVTVR
jgi:hypothetical protein